MFEATSDPTQSTFGKASDGIGYTYDKDKDAFYEPQPYASWILNTTTCLWEAPTAYPSDGKIYAWDESSKSWTETS